mmetsp:Transcript_20798/g.43676  ORF Transcript_20798/g.43676 Transcript_20798/m.43676 type:complete len:143 (-) Transcript_20798:869-1297(-)
MIVPLTVTNFAGVWTAFHVQNRFIHLKGYYCLGTPNLILLHNAIIISRAWRVIIVMIYNGLNNDDTLILVLTSKSSQFIWNWAESTVECLRQSNDATWHIQIISRSVQTKLVFRLSMCVFLHGSLAPGHSSDQYCCTIYLSI